MGYGMLNVGSLLIGLAAWILPVINIAGRKKRAGFPVMSAGACAVALYMQILYGSHLVKIEDWSALMDISGGVTLVSSVLLIGTAALNIAAMIIHRRKGTK